MGKYDVEKSFQITGQLIDIIWKQGCVPKYLKLAVDHQELWLKISKELRHELNPSLSLQQRVTLTGTLKRSKKTGIPKLRAETLHLTPDPTTATCAAVTPQSKPATVLVCQKSDCRKRGADRICEQLEQTLTAAGLEQQVCIKKTGCLKRCKQGPNVVFMPDKANYSRVRANEIQPLVHKHLAGHQYFLENP